MKPRQKTDTLPAVGHLCTDRWDQEGLHRRWMLPVADVTMNRRPAKAAVRLVEEPDGTIRCSLIVEVAS